MRNWLKGPLFSLIVIIYDMEREAPRTLHSLSTRYQRHVCQDDYEVIVVDNGSPQPFSLDHFKDFGSNFQIHYLPNASPSPARAINFGVERSRGKYVGIIIDGARISSPGIIYYSLCAFRAFRNPVVTTLAWHLGPDIQRRAIEHLGYSKDREDHLLKTVQWPEDGYRLFEISTLGGSNKGGWFFPLSESSYLCMSKKNYEYLKGYDERFDQPGGGFLSMDMYIRACEQPDTDLVVLLGEGVFHQMHGGAMTGATRDESIRKMEAWSHQYYMIRDKTLQPPGKRPHYVGHVPVPALKTLYFSSKSAFLSLEENKKEKADLE